MTHTAHPLARVLIVAPHPDDEVIATGGIIQRVIAGGGIARVLLLTAGERNFWPQVATLRRWRITPEDRHQWGDMRLREAEDGLTTLGAPAGIARFLGYPDSHLASLARTTASGIEHAIETQVEELDPSLVVSPSAFDFHPDHRAASWLVHHAVARRAPLVTYVVHGSAPHHRHAFSIRLEPDEVRRKRAAIECHASQLILSRNRFTQIAPAETFFDAEYDVVRIPSRFSTIVASLRHALHAATRLG